jgi:hypothetical protein
MVHELGSTAPKSAVRQKQRAKVARHELCDHGQLLAGQVEGNALADEVVGDLNCGHDDVGGIRRS